MTHKHPDMKNYMKYHTKDCGTIYRNCSPNCPNNIWSNTGIWVLGHKRSPNGYSVKQWEDGVWHANIDDVVCIGEFVSKKEAISFCWMDYASFQKKG